MNPSKNKELKTGDPHLRLIISNGFNDINIKSIMTVLDNKPLTIAHINKKPKKTMMRI